MQVIKSDYLLGAEEYFINKDIKGKTELIIITELAK